jgi:hypothetical protein
MKRRAFRALATLALATAAFSACDRKHENKWYHESDVALLATTGRPQLVEFFHPD